ncbi:uncharacterized protein LOC113464737 [Ceratina calcarata]|uniref:Uncharacterized protein LOC113464737 n=1 Tax=Ceratina calcarata TaxID=156304 RepID=A0AAJ7S6Z4_9HYME|nr:uncharacterized protein LOC113464737 [Ceratina calcarata]
MCCVGNVKFPARRGHSRIPRREKGRRARGLITLPGFMLTGSTSSGTSFLVKNRHEERLDRAHDFLGVAKRGSAIAMKWKREWKISPIAVRRSPISVEVTKV